ncbi:MAG: hypothetical protein KC416_05255, partial [Myxococcales bacterium]|nr:hypothetical protein [Myxococcales bacterium]
LNWGASYWVNDIYRRFLRPGRDDRHYVRASRVAMVLLTLMAAGTSLLLTSVADTWKLLLALGSGQGLVVLLRWYWWRINAWSEISAMIASAIATFVLTGMIEDYALRLVLVVAISTVVWVLVTYVTRPVAAVHLRRFHSRVRPRGGFWGPYAEGDRGSHRPSRDLLSWVLGLVFVYGLTFAVGKLALGYWAEGIALLVAGLVAGFFALRSFRMEEEGT